MPPHAQSGKAYDAALGELGLCLDGEKGEWRGCSRSQQIPLDPPLAEAPPEGPDQDLQPRPAPPQTDVFVQPPETGIGTRPPDDEADEAAQPLEEAEENAVLDEDASAWRTYRNPRLGTVAELPPGFSPGTRIDEGDGQTFMNEDGRSEIAVYATLLEGQPFPQYRQWYGSALGSISYEAGGRNWFVLSGIDQGKIFYVKVVRSERCGIDIAHHVVLRYPQDEKRRFDNLVERVANSLRGTTPMSFCGG